MAWIEAAGIPWASLPRLRFDDEMVARYEVWRRWLINTRRPTSQCEARRGYEYASRLIDQVVAQRICSSAKPATEAQPGEGWCQGDLTRSTNSSGSKSGPTAAHAPPTLHAVRPCTS
jgi:hypothetical protein